MGAAWCCKDLEGKTIVEVPGGGAPKECMGDVYSVTLDRDQGGSSKLGLEVDCMGEVLPVRAVTGGVAEQWNLAHPQCRVMKGDLIIEVNGTQGNGSIMLSSCRTDRLLRLTLVRMKAAESGLARRADSVPEPPPPPAAAGQSSVVAAVELYKQAFQGSEFEDSVATFSNSQTAASPTESSRRSRELCAASPRRRKAEETHGADEAGGLGLGAPLTGATKTFGGSEPQSPLSFGEPVTGPIHSSGGGTNQDLGGDLAITASVSDRDNSFYASPGSAAAEGPGSPVPKTIAHGQASPKKGMQASPMPASPGLAVSWGKQVTDPVTFVDATTRPAVIGDLAEGLGEPVTGPIKSADPQAAKSASPGEGASGFHKARLGRPALRGGDAVGLGEPVIGPIKSCDKVPHGSVEPTSPVSPQKGSPTTGHPAVLGEVAGGLGEPVTGPIKSIDGVAEDMSELLGRPAKPVVVLTPPDWLGEPLTGPTKSATASAPQMISASISEPLPSPAKSAAANTLLCLADSSNEGQCEPASGSIPAPDFFADGFGAPVAGPTHSGIAPSHRAFAGATGSPVSAADGFGAPLTGPTPSTAAFDSQEQSRAEPGLTKSASLPTITHHSEEALGFGSPLLGPTVSSAASRPEKAAIVVESPGLSPAIGLTPAVIDVATADAGPAASPASEDKPG